MKFGKIKFLTVSLLVPFCLLISGKTIAQKDTLSILHISDLHLILNQHAYIPEMMEYRKKKQYNLGEIRLRHFLETIPEKTNSDVVIATGDLVDFFESETIDSSMLDIQPEQFSKLLNEYQIPMLLTLGNHDIFTFEWDDTLKYKLLHNQNHAGRARSLWIRNVSCFQNGTYYSKVKKVGRTTYRLIFLDDSFYQFLPEDKTAVTPYIDKSQLYWLNQQLHESEDDIEIIFMHIPFTSKNIEQKTSSELYTSLAKNPSCKLIVAGHHHKSIVKKIPIEAANEIVQVQTGALVKNPENWRLIRLTEDNILVSETGKTENELVINIE